MNFEQHERGARTPLPAPRAPRTARHARTLAAVHAAAGFIVRVAELELGDVRGYIGDWHAAVARDAEAWFEAEAAVAEAVVQSRRQGEQRVLLRQIAETITNAVWYRRARQSITPEHRVGATEASAQYTATLAMLALLARDHLAPRHFSTVYAPFARRIPVAELVEDAGRP